MTNLISSLLLLAGLMSLQTGLAQSNYTSYFTGNATDLAANPTGGICLMGGGTENDNAMRWFLERASGGDILVLRASGSDGYNEYFFSELGISVNSVESIVFSNASAAQETYIHDRISKAEAIWLAGGDQANYVNYWRNTIIATLINERITQDNIVIGGTSAGMAVLGGAYFAALNGTVTSEQALANPYDSRVTIGNDDFFAVPFLENVITDSHYNNPDRKGRHTTFLARALTDYGVPYFGIACNEFTSVCIDENGVASIYGGFPDFDDTAYFLTPNCGLMDNTPETCVANQALTWNQNGQALKVYEIKGTPTGLYTFDLNTWSFGDGGDWQDWFAAAGSLTKVAGLDPDCSPVSTSEPTAAVDFNIYPNPTTSRGGVHVTSSDFTRPGKARLSDTRGIMLKQWTNVSPNDYLQLPELDFGTYYLTYYNAVGSRTRKIVIR